MFLVNNFWKNIKIIINWKSNQQIMSKLFSQELWQAKISILSGDTNISCVGYKTTHISF